MKSPFLYSTISLVSLLTAFGIVIFIGLAVFGSVVEQKMRWDLFAVALILLVITVILRALLDIGTRLMQVEEFQWRLMKEIEGMRNERNAGKL